MWHLVKKDILLCRIGIVFIILINFFLGYLGLIFMSLLMSEPPLSSIMLGYVLFMGLFLTLSIVLEREQKVDGDMILHSIPLDKKIIVTSRYISSLLFPSAHGLIIFIYSYVLQYTRGLRFTGFRMAGNIQGISIFTLLTVLSVVVIFLSFYLPLYYSKYGKGKAHNIMAYFFLIILPAIVFKFKDNILNLEFVKYINSLDKRMFTLMGFVGSIILYVASMEVSKKIYAK